ncbi:MAG: histidinol-phosphate transaminase [Bdellovibrionaceae bacterium]|nr:histidinol-phosphate transaminase [Pseudobdellovibrionaceae bacterium]
MKVAPEILSLVPYSPGKPISETKREYGLSEVVKLASNECPIGPSQKMMEAMTEALKDINRYPDGAAFELKRAMSKYLKVSPEKMVFGNGSNELIDLLLKVYCRPGDAIMISEYSFIAYKISAQASSVDVIEIPTRAQMKFDLAAMATTLESNDKIRLIFLPNPNNPTGEYFSTTEFKEFMKTAAERDVLVVLDEAYREFVRADNYPDGIEQMNTYDNVVVLRTMSKVFGLAGLRVGVLVAPESVTDLINRVRNPFNVNSIAQAAVIAALGDKDHLKRVQVITWSGVEQIESYLKRQGLRFLPTQANFVLFDAGFEGDVVFKELLKRGVILRPVTNYGLPTYLRWSVGLHDENEVAMKALTEVLSVLRN